MATQNQINTILKGQTGTGTFVGSVSPTLTGTPVLPTPFTLGATSVTSTGTQLNYLSGLTAVPINKVVTQVITANGTYTPTTGMVYCIVELCGGGGGGGGAGNVTISNAIGGGGGYGASCRKTYTAALIGANAAVVIGAAGAAGAAASGNGGTGGTSTFTPAGAGAVLTAPGAGGGGGGTGNLTQNSVGGAAGARPSIATGGDINDAGSPGHYGFTFNLASSVGQISGGGASGKYGSGGIELSGSTQAGVAALGFGAGGSGALSGGADTAGGIGTAGICIINEFLSA